MAQEFKDFDVKYAAYKGKTLKRIEEIGGSVAQEDINSITFWDEKLFGKYTIFSTAQIRVAVYEAIDAEDWQKFRVGLKGLTTKEKLYCLAWLWNHHQSILTVLSSHEYVRIRVNNYLGALVRGGQLDIALNVRH